MWTEEVQMINLTTPRLMVGNNRKNGNRRNNSNNSNNKNNHSNHSKSLQGRMPRMQGSFVRAGG